MNVDTPLKIKNNSISSPIRSFLREINSNKYMYLLAIPGIIFFFVFAYLPLAGIVIAFQNFKPLKGILGSEFVGLKNFEFFFTSSDWGKVTFNTIYLNVLFILTGTVVSIMIAVMLAEINRVWFKKITQSLMILPNFISWAVVAMFSIPMLSSDTGIINQILKNIGLDGINFFSESYIWPFLLVIIRLWKGAGFGSIVYLAVITGIDQEIYEAAKIDGANRLQCIFNITLPMLKNTVIVLTVLSIGGIFYGDMGMIYALVGDNPMLYPTTDVIDTFVFRSLRRLGNMGMASAVGFFQSVVGFVLVVATNTIAKKIDKDAAIF